jgi:hypothetical protein
MSNVEWLDISEANDSNLSKVIPDIIGNRYRNPCESSRTKPQPTTSTLLWRCACVTRLEPRARSTEQWGSEI